MSLGSFSHLKLIPIDRFIDCISLFSLFSKRFLNNTVDESGCLCYIKDGELRCIFRVNGRNDRERIPGMNHRIPQDLFWRKEMKRFFLLVLIPGLIVFLSLKEVHSEEVAERIGFKFQEAPPRSGTGMRFEQTEPDRVKFSMTSAKFFGSEWIYSTFSREVTAQQKLVFRAKGAPKNGTAFFSPILVIKEGNRSRAVSGPSVPVNNGDFRLYVFGLDTDFHLGDGRYTVQQLQFSFNSAREPVNKDLTAEVDHLRFADPDEVTRRNGTKIVVHRKKPAPIKAAAPEQKKLLIYFDFDNNDEKEILDARRPKTEPIEDYAGDFSYRRLLLEHCALLKMTQDPREADVLVYQRTIPSERAKLLAQLAREGKPLVLYGSVPDRDLAALSPLELERLPNEHFAPREKLVSPAPDQLTDPLRIQNCRFGRYFKARTVSGAKTLLEFSPSHDPYLARKGNVIHCAGTSGTTLVSSNVFYDKAALLLWCGLAGRSDLIPLINRQEAEGNVSSSFEKEGLTWHRTTDGFGRFGWQIGDFGLFDSISSDLTVSNGDQIYRVDMRSWNAPELSLTGESSDVLKQYRITAPNQIGAYSLSLSLLSPFEIWRFEKENRIFLAQENIADYTAWETSKGIKITSLAKRSDSSVLFDGEKDEPWSASWLLLYQENEARPLLLVFPRQPKKIAARIRYGVLEGFEIDLAPGTEKNPAVLAAGWPWGAVAVDLPKSGARLSHEIVGKIRRLVSSALLFPTGRQEFFALDPKNKRIRFRMDVSFERFADDWNTVIGPQVFLPPLTGFMLLEGRAGRLESNMVETSEPLRNFNLPTRWGPMLGKTGTTIEWTLPFPDLHDLIFARTEDPKLNALQDKLFLDGVKWSCGGHVPLDAFTPQHPERSDSSERNISYFSWNFGLCTALQGQLLLSEEARKQLERRVVLRTIEPIELYQMKAFARHRQEPFSGKCYPVMFKSFYPATTLFEPAFGSKVIYGDTNESATVTVWLAQLLADLNAMPDLIRANWNFYRYVMRHQLYLDDYCFHAGSCRESGAGAWIDMLNAEHCGMLAYARLAEISGDEPTRAEALARSAKKSIPVVARLYFNQWLEKIRPELKGESYLVTGFGEDGAKIMTFPTQSFNFFGANDLFDFSQGIPGTQYHLYRRYAWNKIQNYLSTLVVPLLMEKSDQAVYEYASALGLYDDRLPVVRKYLEKVMAIPKNQKAEDWPGIRGPFQIACTQWRTPERLALSTIHNLSFDRASYDPDRNVLVLECRADSNSRLELMADRAPGRVVRNGKPINLSGDGVFYNVPLVPGKNDFVIEWKR